MKRFLILAFLFAAPAAFAQGNGLTFLAQLNGFQEVPSVATAGRGTLQLDLAGNGTEVMQYTLTFSGLQSPIQQAHIHVAQAGVNGSIVIWLCGTTALPGPAGTPTCPQSGTVQGQITSANVVAGATASQQLGAGDFGKVLSALRASAAYANIHTVASPGGEIRGQIF
jgi:hypothetical protein